MPDITLPLDKLAALAVEHWRLSTALSAEIAGSPAARHALRKMDDFFKALQLEIRSLDGLPYDAGLSARVTDTVSDPSLPKGTAIVSETLAPLVLYKGSVLRPAEVVVASH